MDAAGGPKTLHDAAAGEAKFRSPVPFSAANGVFKKHALAARPPPPPATVAAVVSGEAVYRECLKNHAASMGGHAVDGCGEFLPSPAANVSDPTSLKCAACGCHRNFHRRVTEPPPPPLPLAQARIGHLQLQLHDVGRDRGQDELASAAAVAAAAAAGAHDDDEDDDDEDEDDDDDEDVSGDGRDGGHPLNPSQSMYFSSAPNMLLALSSGGPNSGARPPSAATAGAGVGSAQPPGMSAARKRFRTKFSPEQKQRMQELSERLGWRLQKRDEAVVDDWCREIGVGKGVFKVWMHNNKHSFLGTGRRGAPSTAAAAAVAGEHPVHHHHHHLSSAGAGAAGDALPNAAPPPHALNGSGHGAPS